MPPTPSPSARRRSSGSSRRRAPSATSSATSASRWRTAPAARRPRRSSRASSLPAFANPALDALADAGTVTVDGTDLAMTTDSFVVKPLRFPGGSIGELAVNGTVNDLAMAGARPQALTARRSSSRRACEADVLRGRGRGDRRGGAGRRRGDRRRRHEGRRAAARPTRCTSARRASGASTTARRALARGAAARRPDPRQRARSALHGTAIMLARGEFELGAEVESDTRPLWPAVDALLDAAGPGLRCLRDATRGGVASVLNELARASGVAMLVREAAVPVPPGGRRRGGAARDRPDARRQRGRARRGRRARARGGGARRAARRGAGGFGEAAEIGEVKTEPPGDGARGDGVRRQAGHGPARRRPAAADLLRGARDGDSRVRTEPGHRRRRSRPTCCGSPSASPARATRWP